MESDPLMAMPALCERAEQSHVPPISANFGRPQGEVQLASATVSPWKPSHTSSLRDTLVDVEPAQRRSSTPFPLLAAIPDAKRTAGFQPSKVLCAIGTMTRRVFGHVARVSCFYHRIEDTGSQLSR